MQCEQHAKTQAWNQVQELQREAMRRVDYETREACMEANQLRNEVLEMEERVCRAESVAVQTLSRSEHSEQQVVQAEE